MAVALTVCQPYAELLLRRHPSGELVKPIENRPWPTQYRGPLVIHAGLSRDWMDEGDSARYPNLVFGAIVGIVDLVACLPLADESKWPERMRHLRDHEHANGPWCLVIERPRRVRPVKWRGARKLWTLPDEVYYNLWQE